MILDVTGDHIEKLSDTDLRALVAQLCEREVKAQGHSPAAVTWGGHQNAGDGGIDVRVSLPAGSTISGYVPKAQSGFQVKAQNMPSTAIQNEMAPGGVVLPTIEALATSEGAYVIVSSKGSTSDSALAKRKAAMAAAIRGFAAASALTLDFYDRRRLATWVNQHSGVVPWVRDRLGLPLSGWHPFKDWSSSPTSTEAAYLLDTHTRLVGPSIKSADGLNAEQAIARLRDILSKPKGVVRLVGLSGVGKTRLIQALFDERIGTNALLRSDALYTDISAYSDPAPQEMLSRLISNGHRVVLIVDNCGAELHGHLAATIASSTCALSLITVEYDINDDEPRYTDIFKLEPATPDLIEKILEARYDNISQVSRRVIAKFSEGNARVAFALAETAKNGDSLANLNDADLFKRLFRQQKEHSPDLLVSAQACALLYSFDGDTLEGPESELAPLARLAGQTVDHLHRNIAILRRRQLVQARGRWRAILPHALANKLATYALQEIPPTRVNDLIVEGTSARMLRSFSRRVGYLHNDQNAAGLAAKWFSQGGTLEPLGRLNTLGEELFENIAPVNPRETLAFIERTAQKNMDWFFGEDNENKDQIVRVIRAIAYDPALFARCTHLLTQFLLREKPGSTRSLLDPLKSLFWICLSGTHATAAQRADIVRGLLESTASAEQDIGLVLLGEMLKSSYFSASHSFEFGAWKRDYGLYPNTDAIVHDWFSHVIDTARFAESSGRIRSDRVRHVFASHLHDVLKAGMIDEVVALTRAFADKGGWPEGWIAIRGAIRRIQDKTDTRLAQLRKLEEQLRPRDLVSMIRGYALTSDYGALDIVDVEDDCDLRPVEARERVNQFCVELGRRLAADSSLLASILPELLASGSQKTASLAYGLASVSPSLVDCWDRVRTAFIEIQPDQRKPHFIAGFLSSAMTRSPPDADDFLDGILADTELHPHFVDWQTSAGVNTKAFERFMVAIALESVPIGSFYGLSGGHAHASLSDEQIHALVVGFMNRPGGSDVAAQIVGMRFFGRRADNVPISDSLRATGRYILSRVELKRSDIGDHFVAELIPESFTAPEHEHEATDFAIRLASALNDSRIYGWDVGDIVAALSKVFPMTVLDVLLENSRGDDRLGPAFFGDMRTDDACLFDDMPDDVWIEWAARHPTTRYELLAQVMRFSTATSDDEHTLDWSPAALKLIQVAPDPLNVLDRFLERFNPNHYGGSLAEHLARRMPLLDRLRNSPNPRIASWAAQSMESFATQIERERECEARAASARDQYFE